MARDIKLEGRWVSSNFKEILPDKVTPLTASMIEHDFSLAVAEQYHSYGYRLPEKLGPPVCVLHSKPYFNCDLLLHVGNECWGLPPKEVMHLLGIQLEPESGSAFQTGTKPGLWYRSWRAMKTGWRCARVGKDLLTAPTDDMEKAAGEIREQWEKAKNTHHRKLVSHLQVNMAAGVVCLTVDKLITAMVREKVQVADLALGNAGGTISSKQQIALRNLTLAARKSEAMASTGAVREYLSRFGHRCRFELELAQPRPIENPENFRDELLSVGIDEKHLAALYGKAQREEKPFYERAREHSGWLRAGVLTFLHGIRCWWIRQREISKYHLAGSAFQLRQIALKVGEDFQARGLQRPEDIFFLTKQEMEKGLKDGSWRVDAALVQARKDQYSVPNTLPEFLDANASPSQALAENGGSANEPGGLLSGVPVSPGVARGPIRVVRTEEDSYGIQEGDIVVMAALDSGWGVVFMGAAGIVTEVGGTLSHAAIVARELGIPAVFNIPRALDRLAEGTIVEVDGSRGVVCTAN